MSFTEVTLELLNGFLTTFLLFLFTFLIAVPLGIFFSRLTMSKVKPLSLFMQLFIWIIRGTPLMLQIIVVFYLPGLLFNLPSSDRFIAVLLALSINYGIYFSEIFRSGYEGVARSQFEAGEVLGLSRRQIFTKVILLQVIKKILPPLSNETISLVKDTALARVIAVSEVLLTAQKIVATYAIIWVLFYTGVFYLALNGLLSFLLKKCEKRLSFYQG
jgi:polar amino acid transport system permease protein